LAVGDDFQFNKGFVYLNVYYDIIGKDQVNQVEIADSDSLHQQAIKHFIKM
jgi:hypothetical protein